MRLIKTLFSSIFSLFFVGSCLWGAGFLGFWLWIEQAKLGKATHLNDMTEAVIVLTGDKNRIHTALEILKDKKTERVFISGVHPQIRKNDIVPRDFDSRLARCCIFLGYQAQNTIQNAVESAGWLSANNIRSARIITSDYHMPRTWLEFNHIIKDAELFYHPVNSEQNERKARLRLIFLEYNKFLTRLVKINLA